MFPYTIFPVSPALRDWVEAIFIMKVDFKEVPFSSVLNYPWSVTLRIYFTIDGDALQVKPADTDHFATYPNEFIIGPRLATDIVDLGSYRHVVGISFKPTGLYRFLGIPITEFGREIDFRLILKSVGELSERLQYARDNQEICMLVEGFLLQRLSSVKSMTAFDKAVAALVESNGNLSISKVADGANLSLRQFERRAIAALGVSPKLYARVLRFSNAWLYKEAYPKMSWYKIAHEFGYSDQMHLVDDFKIFSGSTPTGVGESISLKLLTGIEGRHYRQVC